MALRNRTEADDTYIQWERVRWQAWQCGNGVRITRGIKVVSPKMFMTFLKHEW